MDYENIIERYEDFLGEEIDRDHLKEKPEELKVFTDILYDTVNNSNKLLNNYKYKDEDVELSMSNILILREIYFKPGITANILAEKFDKSAAYMSRTIRKLEDDKLITREIDLDNRIYFNIYLTSKGEKVALDHQIVEIETISKYLDKYLEKYSVKEVSKLLEMMNDLNNLINSKGEDFTEEEDNEDTL